MPEPQPGVWEEFLAHIAETSLGADEAASRAFALHVSQWLERADPLVLCPPRPVPEGAARSLVLLAMYERLHRQLSQVLYTRSYAEEPPLLASDFADWATGSIARETYLGLHLVGVAFTNGLDIQSMSLIRQIAEFGWRALLLAADPEVAELWWDALASASTKRVARLAERQLYREIFFPAELMRRVAAAQVTLDGVPAEETEAAAQAVDRTLENVYYKLLSGSMHGGTDMVYTSVTRGYGEAPPDPLAMLGRPSEMGLSLVGIALWLQQTFWRYFPRAAFGEALLPPPRAGQTLPDADEVDLFLAVRAVTQVVDRAYGDCLWQPPLSDEDTPES